MARVLGVANVSIADWRKRFPDDSPAGFDVPSWQAFMAQHGLAAKKGAGQALKDEKTRHEIELLKAKLARENRKVIDREEVGRLLLHLSTQGRTMLYQFLETEAPPKLDGLPAAAQRPILREMADAIADKMADAIAQFERQ